METQAEGVWSRPWAVLFPLSPAYWVLSRLHALWMRARARPVPSMPLIVVGALRAGGSGKTSVTAALAVELRARGLRVGILAWRVGPGRGREAAQPVGTDSDWRIYSDEAIWLARETGCPVFATRDRFAAWRTLADGPFDILISDDGFQDRRLDRAYRLLLAAPGERPGPFDLLPAGNFRETYRARFRADRVLEGPLPICSSPSATGFRRRIDAPAPGSAPAWIVLAALGDPEPFLADLRREGLEPVAVLLGRNHGALPLRRLEALRRAHPGAKVLCTAKEAVRLEGQALGQEGVVVRQKVELPAGLADGILAALGKSVQANLVH